MNGERSKERAIRRNKIALASQPDKGFQLCWTCNGWGSVLQPIEIDKATRRFRIKQRCVVCQGNGIVNSQGKYLRAGRAARFVNCPAVRMYNLMLKSSDV